MPGGGDGAPVLVSPAIAHEQHDLRWKAASGPVSEVGGGGEYGERRVLKDRDGWLSRWDAEIVSVVRGDDVGF